MKDKYDVIVLGAGFSVYFYTALPFKLVFRGTEELFIGLDFGILLTVGAFYVQTGFFALEPLIASLPIALLVAAILYINEFQDYKADVKAGKNYLVARTGKRRAHVGFGIMVLMTIGTRLTSGYHRFTILKGQRSL